MAHESWMVSHVSFVYRRMRSTLSVLAIHAEEGGKFNLTPVRGSHVLSLTCSRSLGPSYAFFAQLLERHLQDTAPLFANYTKWRQHTDPSKRSWYHHGPPPEYPLQRCPSTRPLPSGPLPSTLSSSLAFPLSARADCVVLPEILDSPRSPWYFYCQG